MKLHSLFVLNRHGNPLYHHTYDPITDQTPDPSTKYTYLAHTSCDLIDERLANPTPKVSSDLYLGLLQTTEGLNIYGYVLNTGARFVLIVSEDPTATTSSLAVAAGGGTVGGVKGEIILVFQQLHAAYIALVCNPFYEYMAEVGGNEGEGCVGEKFDAVVEELGKIHS
ncbi:Longin-like domain-containing protein [Kickxella alabastrina]|uniref:Longin-like domain-containing protein n=1 Tax=Kickxella alabastrina TaxID=61397 RepID=UPI00221F2803|nr:Longin-like domain-containing protein [Kickxella alabastrina]KAI7834426.1 Longin-like domain-containing protein [Kickxella alabastrina]